MHKSTFKKLMIAVITILTFSITAAIISMSFLKEQAAAPILKTDPIKPNKLTKSIEQTKPIKQRNPSKINFDEKNLTMLKAEENRITNSSSQDIILKGLMPPDLYVLNKNKKFNKAFFKNISDTGANVVRIPVHPNLWIKDKNYLKKYIVPAVAWAKELGMYAIIDLHYIGNIVTGEGNEMPKIDAKSDVLAREFWTKTSSYFKDTPNVIFEICNEPANIDALQWRECADELVDLIRNQGAKQLVIVGGIQYSQDLSWVKDTPISDDNIAYTSHIYPAHNKQNWDMWFGDISKLKPVLITEWGFIDENRENTKQSYLIGDKESYGTPFIDYLDKNYIGWVACWYDDVWEPQMFKKSFSEYTNYGKFVSEILK